MATTSADVRSSGTGAAPTVVVVAPAPAPLADPSSAVPSIEVTGNTGNTGAVAVNRPATGSAATSPPAVAGDTSGGTTGGTTTPTVADRSRAVTSVAKQSDDDNRDNNGKSQNSSATTTTRRNNSTAASPSSTTTTVAKVITKTYSLVGGKTQIDFSADSVTVKFATPDTGWKVIKQDLPGGAVEVRFVNGSSVSTIKAWWADGARTKIDNASDKNSSHDDD